MHVCVVQKSAAGVPVVEAGGADVEHELGLISAFAISQAPPCSTIW
jgi:hypothetical protein